MLTAWMLEGQICWVKQEEYKRGQILKLLDQRTRVRVLVENKVHEVSIKDITRASNSKTQDIVDLPYINEPEILDKFKEPVYLDKIVITQFKYPSLKEQVEYRIHVEDRLLKSKIPPNLFSSIFFAYQQLDLGQNVIILVDGKDRRDKIKYLIHFIKGEFAQEYEQYHNQNQPMVIRIIMSKKRPQFLDIQLLDGTQINQKQNLQFLEDIQIISLLDYPDDGSSLSNYIDQWIIQTFYRINYKLLKQSFLKDGLTELSSLIKFHDNLEELQSILIDSNIKDRIDCLGELYPVFVKSNDLNMEWIKESIEFYKKSYPNTINYIEFYQRYHHLDQFNKKIPLNKHLSSNQDMRALVMEIAKRLIHNKGIVFGATNLYLKREAMDALQSLICQHNLKLSKYVRIIQRALRVKKFRNVVNKCMKLLINKKSKIKEDHQSDVSEVKDDNKQFESFQQKEISYEISDPESYSLLDFEQQSIYKIEKLKQSKQKQQCLLSGELFKQSKIACSLLTEKQIQLRDEAMKEREYKTKLIELEQIQYSDLDSFNLLNQEQKFVYLTKKKQGHQNVAYNMLDLDLQNQIRQQRKLKKLQSQLEKYYDQLEPFLSDIEAFKQLNLNQQSEYKCLKLKNEQNVAIKLLNNQQQFNRRQALVTKNIVYNTRKKFDVQDDISDLESFKMLTSKDQYVKQKKNYLEGLLFSYQQRFEEDNFISDICSYKLLSKEQKNKYRQIKGKLRYQDISDQDAYLLLESQNEYKMRKQNGELNVAKQLIDPKVYDKAIEKKILLQQRLDEINVNDNKLVNSIAFSFLDENQWNQRKKILVEQQEKQQESINSNQYPINFYSVAYQLLSIDQKSKRKQTEIRNYKLKKILNPLLFNAQLNPYYSVAYQLLQDKNKVYNNLSLSFSLLEDKKLRLQKVNEITLYPWDNPNSLAEKQDILHKRIEQYEIDLQTYGKEYFSDYEAFKLLGEEQKEFYKQGSKAYELLDEEQKLLHRVLITSKLKKQGDISDIESYEMLTQAQKDQYYTLKVDDVSDYPSYDLLDNKQLYFEEKKKKKIRNQEINDVGMAIYFNPDPQLMQIEEYDQFMKQNLITQQKIRDEEYQLSKQINIHQNHEKPNYTNIVQKLIGDPDSQPYYIPKNQNSRKLLDANAANEKHEQINFDEDFQELMNKNKFFDYCGQITQTFGKNLDKLMKCSSEKLKKPLIPVQNEEPALLVFRSIVKYAHMKRSRYPVKEHLNRILIQLIGPKAKLEPPPPPKQIQRQSIIQIEKQQSLNDNGLTEEVMLQIVKQLEGNKKENIIHLLKLTIIILNCVQYNRPLQLIQYFNQKLETKMYQENELYKLTKRIIRILSYHINEKVFQDEVKIPFCPRMHLPFEQEIQIMQEVKQVIIKVFLFSETPIWIQIDHMYDVQITLNALCQYLGKQAYQEFFYLSIVERRGNLVKGVFALDNHCNMMDQINKYEYYEDIYRAHHNVTNRYDFYLTLSESCPVNSEDLDTIEILFHQYRFDLKWRKHPDNKELLMKLEKIALTGEANIDFKIASKLEAKIEFINIMKLY